MTLEDWNRQIGKPTPRLRKDGRWEARISTKSRRASVYADTLEQLAHKIRPDLLQPSVPSLSWAGQSIGNWAQTSFFPLYDSDRRAAKTRANVANHIGKLLDFRPDGARYLADLPPSELTLVNLIRAFHVARQGYKTDNSLASMCRSWNRFLSLMAEAELIPPLLPKRFARECPAPAYKRKEAAPSVETVIKVIRANPGNPVAAILTANLILGADLTEATIIPRSGLVANVAKLKGTKNTYRDRTVPIPNDVKASLLDVAGSVYLAELAPGKPIRNNLNRRLYDACAKAGLCRPATHKKANGKKHRVQPDPMPFTYKSVRHTFTGIEHILGCPKAVRVFIMGHSPNSIDQAYQHPEPASVMSWLSQWHRHCYTPLQGSEMGSNLDPKTPEPLGSI